MNVNYWRGVWDRARNLPDYLFRPNMKTVRIPLVGSPHHRQFADSDTFPAISTLDQRFVNVIFKRDLNPLTGAQRLRVCKRPGTDTGTAATTDITGNPYCVTDVEPTSGGGIRLFGVWKTLADANKVRFSLTGVGYANPTVTGNAGASRALRYGNSNILFWVVAAVAANRKAFYNASAGEITDADFPIATIVGNFVYMDGYAFIMVGGTGRIYNSDVNDVTAWTSTSFLTTQTGNDGRGLALLRDKIAAFGGDYIEFYENVGNSPGSPLQQIDHLRLNGYGLAGDDVPLTAADEPGHRVLEAMNTVFWINNSNLETGPGVYMMEGFSPKKISSPDVDYDLSRHLDTSLKILGIIELFGMRFLLISTGDQSTDYVWAYCFELGSWTTWESAFWANAHAANNNPARDAGTNEVIITAGTEHFKIDIESLLSTDISYTDDGSAYTATIQTRNIDFDNNRKKFWRRFTLIGADSREASATNVSWSDDDGQTWSTARALDMNDGRPSTTRLGASRRRQWRITNAADAPFEAEAMELTFTVGAH